MLVEIKGVQFINKGAELMLHAVIQKLEQDIPEAKIVLDPKPSSPYEKRAKLGALQKLSFRKLFIDLNQVSYWLPKRLRDSLRKKWGIVMEADIDLVLDASGFAYGDQFRPIIIQQMCSEVKRAARNGKKYVLLPQALGVFSRTKDVERLKSALPKATLVFPREQSSFDNVTQLVGDLEHIQQFPDFTNLVKGILPEYFVDGQKKVLIIPNSNMISSRNKNKTWLKSYVTILSRCVEAVKERGYVPVLLNHEGKDDEAICREIIASVGELELIEEADPLKVKGIIGASKGIICSRFHGCVSALTQGIPSLGTSWSHKYERLYEEYGVSNCLIQPDSSAEELSAQVELLLSGGASPDEGKIEHYKSLTSQMWQTIYNKIGK